MNKFLLLLLLLFVLFTHNTSAQSPNISYSPSQTLYIGKPSGPITATNTGAAVPNRLYPQYNFFIPNVNLFSVVGFVISSSGDIFVAEGAQIYRYHPDGTSAVFAGKSQYGSIDGTGTDASFQEMTGIAKDAADNLYVVENNPYDGANSKIRKITPSGVVTTFASGLTAPNKIAVAGSGILYVSTFQSKIMKIAADGTLSLLAGQGTPGRADGVGADASFYNPAGLVTDQAGNVYVNDFGNSLIRKITPGGLVSTFAGSTYGTADGNGIAAQFFNPTDIAIDSKQNLIIADGQGLVRKINPSATVTTIGQPPYYDNQNTVTYPSYPSMFTLDANDNIVSFSGNGFYRLLTTGYSITPVLPQGLTFGTDGSIGGVPAVLSGKQIYTVRAQNADGVSSATISLEVLIPSDPPVITSFSPASAATGDLVTITGNYFTGTTAVSIGGQPVSSFSVLSPTSLTANLSAGSLTGDITVTNPNGTASISGFNFIPPPVITSFSPASGARGAVITITGTGFTDIRQVQIGGYSASFTVISPTQIRAIVGDGGSGDIYLYAASGSADQPGFTYLNAPSISTIYPISGGTGTTITITGNDFGNATAVKFGTTAASSFTVVSPSTITAVVADGSANGVTVTTPGGSTTYTNFTYIGPPVISQVNPLRGGVGSVIYIYGLNLAGAQVTIGGVVASISYYNTPTQLSVNVPNGGSSGDIKVTTPSGTATFPGFVWIPAPVITSFSPQTAAVGDKVTITGSNFTGAALVYFGGISAVFTVLSPTTIEATVGSGASGPVTVISEGGSATLNGFVHSGPAISSFSPTIAGAGTTVTINGSNFTGVTEVDFGGTPASSFAIISPTKITAVVGQGKSGDVTVISAKGTGIFSGFVHTGPSISYFSPGYSGPNANSTISISGNNFTGTTSVTFGGVPAASFTVLYPTLITAVPANGASGDVVVTNALGSDKKSGFVWASAPTIVSISPTSQTSFNMVTVTGTNFYGVTGVTFGGTPAAYFYTNSPTSIVAYPAAGTSGDVTVATAGGTASISGFVFSSPTIQSINPLFAAAGQTVTITGSNLNGIQAVKFGGSNAASFSIVSSGTITAVLAAGATGPITINGPNGSASFAGFTFVNPPVITSITPNQGGLGSLISINGANLATVTNVTIGGVPASVRSASDNQVWVTAGSGATGKISLTNIAGTTLFDGFTWYPAPVITSVDPVSASAQSTVTITGENFTGVTDVKFGSSIASFTIVSPTQIKAQPLYGATGDISITGPGGTGVLPGFVFIPAPTITGFSTVGEGQNAVVTITGTDLENASAVQFGGIAAQNFAVVSAQSITASPGAGASGSITVTTPGGTGSIAGFLYKKPPIISSFSPMNGPIGTIVSIGGDNFSSTATNNVVYFGPVKARVISATQTQLQVVAPAGATGLITVVNVDKALSVSSNLPFLITNSSGFNGFSNKFNLQFSTNIPPYAIEDFDGDGQLDLLIAKDDSIYILRHGADPVLSRSSFSKKVILETGRNAGEMVIGDLDGDGRKDIIYSINRSLVVLHNTSANGSISFVQEVFEGLSNEFTNMTLRDIDMDGRPDLVMGSGVVYPNTTVGSRISFGSLMFLANTSSSSNISFALTDVDGDNKPDPIYGSSYTGFSIFQNNSVPGNIISSLFPLTYILHSGYYYTSGEIFTADFDGDNKPDIVENDFADNLFLVSRNTAVNGSISTSSFAQPTPYYRNSFFTKIQGADIDGDGKMDIIGQSNTDVFYARNTSSAGNISFTNVVPLVAKASANNVQSVSLRDMDGDGKMDVVLLDGNTSTLTIYNNGPAAIPQITAVTPLTAGNGATVTITGKYLDATTAVTFGGMAATSFKVIAPDTVTAVIGAGNSGDITLLNPDGPSTFSGFKFISPPTISSAIAATDGSGTLTIIGSNLSTATAIAISNTKALSFTVNSDSQITAKFNFTTGKLSVTTAGGTATLDNIAVKAKQIINFAALSNRVYGDDDFVLSASSNNTNMPITYSTDAPGIVSIVNSKLHILAAGTVKITASQAGDVLNNPASDVAQVLTISKKNLQVEANNLTRVYGQANPVFVVTYNGFATNDNASNLTVLPAVTTAANLNSPAGSYDLIASGAAADNYTFSYVKGALIIAPAVLSIKVDRQTKVYGAANPPLTVSYNGFANGDIADNLLTRPVIITSATATSAVGAYAIMANGASSPNYSINYIIDSLSVTPAVLIITANNQSKFYSDNNPVLTASFAGFVNGDTNAIFIGQPAETTTATTLSAAGSYPITISGANAKNYTINYVPGVLTIMPAPAPTIATVNASTAISGSTITLTGTYFLGATGVSFGGKPATSFIVNSPTSVTAIVGNGASGDVSIITPTGAGSLGGFVFVPVPVITAGGPTTILSTDNGVLLTANPGIGFSYQWMNNGVNINGATNATYKATQTGQYSVVISLNGLSQNSAAIKVTSVFNLPPSNFLLTITSETCNGSSDAFVKIKAAQSLNYTATITGNGINKAFAFTDTTTISSLSAGTYSICITVAGQNDYSNCYTATVTQPQPLSVYASLNNSAKSVNLALNGGAVYLIELNGAFYKTTENKITLPLHAGNNNLKVTTDKPCQGTFEKLINASGTITVYPVPFQDAININIGDANISNVDIKIYDTTLGKLVFANQYVNRSGILRIEVGNLGIGVYALYVTLDKSQSIFKIRK